MGSACAELFTAAGFPVLLTSRRGSSAAACARRHPGAAHTSLEELAARADILVLATPILETCSEIAPRIRGAARWKPVIDVSNPVYGPVGLSTDAPTSAAEMISRELPNISVVKALNCVSARQLVSFARRLPPLTIPIAGDDLAAKDLVRFVLEMAGFDVADAGPLDSSRLIESLTQLLRQFGQTAEVGDAIGFRLVWAAHPATAYGGVA